MSGRHTTELLNRELSWLDFNERVLALAEDENVPLLERAKFLAIFSSNLDEFPGATIEEIELPALARLAALERAQQHDGGDADRPGAVPAATRGVCQGGRGHDSSVGRHCL